MTHSDTDYQYSKLLAECGDGDMSELRYTEAQFIEHLKTGLGNEFNCLICGGKYRNWTDLHGEVYCLDCGMTYQILRCMLRDEWLVEHGLTYDDVTVPYTSSYLSIPLYRAYWQDMHGRLPVGSWIGNHENSYTREDNQRFWRWLYEQRGHWQEAYSDYFQWDVIVQAYAPHSEVQS